MVFIEFSFESLQNNTLYKEKIILNELKILFKF